MKREDYEYTSIDTFLRRPNYIYNDLETTACLKEFIRMTMPQSEWILVALQLRKSAQVPRLLVSLYGSEWGTPEGGTSPWNPRHHRWIPQRISDLLGASWFRTVDLEEIPHGFFFFPGCLGAEKTHWVLRIAASAQMGRQRQTRQ